MADDDLGFVPDQQPQQSQDLGFVPAQPDMSAMKGYFNQNVKSYRESLKGQEKNPDQQYAPKEISSIEDFENVWNAGWQMSTTALGLTRQKMPDTVLPEDASTAARVLSNAATVAGDVPLMIAGSRIGGLLGAPAGPGGVVVGAGAGAFALPAGARKIMIDHYQKGDIQTWGDFYDRASGALLETVKGGAVGAATAIAGPAAGKLLPEAASPLLKLGATSTAELATMTTVGKALEGKVPNKQDFIDNAILLGAFHTLSLAGSPPKEAARINDQVQNKLMDTYVQTGLHPNEVYEAAATDPVLRQQLLSDDPALPESLQAVQDPNSNNPVQMPIRANQELTDPHPALGAAKDESTGQLTVEPLTPKETKGEAPPRTPSEEKILERIGTPGEAPKEKMTWDKFYYNTVDKFDPIKVATEALTDGKVISPKDDPYAMVRTTQANGRRAEAAIENGPADFKTLEPTGTPGIREIFSNADNDRQGLTAYIISKRAIEAEGQGKPTGVDLEAANQVVKDGAKKFEQPAKQLTQFQNDVTKYLKDSGVISEDAYNSIVENNKNYVPFKRLMNPEEQGGNGAGGQGLNIFNPLKKMEGSERQLIDPLESIIKNTHDMIALAEKNRALSTLTDLIDKTKNPELGAKIKIPKKAIEANQSEAEQVLKSMGLNPDDAEAFTLFKNKNDLEDNQIASYKDGKRQVYEVPQLLADSVKQLDAQDVGNVVRLLSGPAKTLRAGMIASPDFQARHFIRQELTSYFASPNRYVPILTTLQGLGGMMKHSPDYYEWLRAGGANDAITSLDSDTIQKQILDLNDQTGFIDKTWNTIKSPLQSLAMITHTLDEARTFGKYLNAKDAGKGIEQAAFEARQSGIDISRTGAKLRAWNMMTPFENMRIQGIDLIGQKFNEDPVGTMTKLMTAVTLPSVYLWYANHDDERWQDIPRYVKDTSFIFMTKDHIWRVPKPFEPGVIFGSLPERVLESYFTDNPRAFKDFQQTMTDSAMPQYIPAFASPMIEQYANKSLMTGSPLISDHMKNVLPEYQSNPYTSDMAKLMAGVLRQVPIDLTQKPGSLGSPAILDNYVRSWGGNLGQYAVQGADAILEKSGAATALGVDYNTNPPMKTLSDTPFIKAFAVRYPAANPQSVGDFYDRFEKIQERLNTIQLLAKQGDFKNMQKEMIAANAEHQMVNLGGYKTAISQQMQLIQKIYKDPSTDPIQKRQQIDQFYTLILNEAHGANKILDQIEKGIGD